MECFDGETVDNNTTVRIRCQVTLDHFGEVLHMNPRAILKFDLGHEWRDGSDLKSQEFLIAEYRG